MRKSPLLAAAFALILPTLAKSHVTADPDSAVADAWFTTALRITHGCENEPTVAVRVKMPPGVLAVKPQAKAGWTIEITKRTLDHPIEGPHGTVTEVVDEIEWRGGPLANAYFDEFGLSMKLPNKAGDTLYFPTIQECPGSSNRWVDIPSANQSWTDMDKPAPFVRLHGGGTH